MKRYCKNCALRHFPHTHIDDWKRTKKHDDERCETCCEIKIQMYRDPPEPRAYCHQKVDEKEQKALADTERCMQEYAGMFKAAGFEYAVPKCIPSEYGFWPSDWFMMGTEFGPIKVGHRKRVINLDWSEVNNLSEKPDLIQFFDQYEVTKGEAYIHAHGHVKLMEYLVILYDKLMTFPEGYERQVEWYQQRKVREKERA